MFLIVLLHLFLKNIYTHVIGIIPKEKPSEIKTVRIVKRQSERRNRERDKKRVTYDDQSSVWVVEEPDISSDDLLDVDEGI